MGIYCADERALCKIIDWECLFHTEQCRSGQKQLFWEMSSRSLWDPTEQKLVLCWHFSLISYLILCCLCGLCFIVWYHWEVFVVTALQASVGCDYQPLSILFVWQQKTAASTCPQAMCPDPWIVSPLCQTSSVLFFISSLFWVAGGGSRWTNTEYSRCNNRSTEWKDMITPPRWSQF